MAKNIHIPKLGMSMTKAKVVEWVAKEGDKVDENQVILVIETDKVTNEIEAPVSGFLHILAEVGRELLVGEIAAVLADTEEELKKLQQEHHLKGIKENTERDMAGVTQVRAMAQEEERIRIAPLARQMAKEHQIDITGIKGSGPGGRIVRADIEKVIEVKKAFITKSENIYNGKRVKTKIPFKGMRLAIAEHMQRSLAVSAQMTTVREIDMYQMVEFRKVFLERENKLGTRISYTDLLIFAIAKALRDNPIINSSLIDNEIVIWEDINIGVAVALEIGEYESGLIVPVVKNADHKSLIEISREVKLLAQKARARKLTSDDVSGGTFTLTNAGMFTQGWSLSTPIINQPQSAIMQTGTVVDRPVALEGKIVIRPIMTCMLTFDHRVLDGTLAAKFMTGIMDYLQNPALLLL